MGNDTGSVLWYYLFKLVTYNYQKTSIWERYHIWGRNCLRVCKTGISVPKSVLLTKISSQELWLEHYFLDLTAFLAVQQLGIAVRKYGKQWVIIHVPWSWVTKCSEHTTEQAMIAKVGVDANQNKSTVIPILG